MSETLYHVSANPHVRDNGSTQKIMLDVIICYKKGTNLSSKTKRFINFVKNNVSL